MNHRLLDRICSHHWHILPSSFEALLLAIHSQGELPEREEMDARPAHDMHGDPFAQMEISQSGVAIVPIHGPLMNGATGSDKYYMGVTSHQDIRDDLEAAQSQGARAILLDINSPGGTVSGTPELAEYIDQVAGAVDLFSFNSGLSASAAEYISAGAFVRYGTPSSINGSIGTILTQVEISKMLEAAGVTVNVFASGPYKGTGHIAKPLSADQRTYLQGRVDSMAAEFKAHMTANRPAMKPDSMQGQVFDGKEAYAAGLLDSVVPSRLLALRDI